MFFGQHVYYMPEISCTWNWWLGRSLFLHSYLRAFMDFLVGSEKKRMGMGQMIKYPRYKEKKKRTMCNGQDVCERTEEWRNMDLGRKRKGLYVSYKNMKEVVKLFNDGWTKNWAEMSFLYCKSVISFFHFFFFNYCHQDEVSKSECYPCVDHLKKKKYR